MTLQRGLPLLWQQYTALFWKNLLLSWRSKRAMFLQLFSSFFFILLIFCIQKIMEKSFDSSTAHKTVTDPTALISPPIPPCEDKFFVKLPCFDFVWSGNHTRRVRDIVDAIRANNPGRPIPVEKVRSFATPDDVDAWLMANPLQTPGALHFKERNPTVISYGVQTNSTPETKRGRSEDPTFKFQIPLQIAAEREIARSLIGDPKFNWVFGFKEFPHPTIEALVVLGKKGPSFFLAIAMFGFVIQLSSLITEKELKLRQRKYYINVLEEEALVKQNSLEGLVDPNIAVQIRGLAKTYPGTTKFGCCCKCKKTSPYHALKGLWMNIAKEQLFCLLGPNGAGKTTTINCLTGINPVTGGDALVYGNSVRSSVGMSNIRKMIGVCPQVSHFLLVATTILCLFMKFSLFPQFDILWDALSGEEHLRLFASIKGLTPASINPMVEKSLAEVKLTEAGKIRAGSYSGGMKRRLSVAVSLIGDPKLVFLDEPTTGMDPITRRHVWDIIQETKKDRAIILTTHSMEEADILSDRIGIMAKGRLRCIGTSIRLKSRFGTGFIANISFAESNNEENSNNGETSAANSHEPVKKFFKHHLNVKPVEENKAFMTFVIPHEKEHLLAKFFGELQDRETEFGISDIQLGLATLEEVFLNIARKAELESAALDGTMVTLELTSGSSVEIPVGARFVGIPGTETEENPRGIMVEVYWQQDESGSLCISGHSLEMPVPENVPATDPVAQGHGRVSLLGRRRRRQQVQGTVIDPEFVSTASRRFSRSSSFDSKRSSL
ncbi:unnamed protein product [Eruca vesicaria subsp. sativa]|uniref:ABC transporter domain-containing protein n=1 Tax=Eruca vesicaria subsp. sativa TaxID=29727 RepID=A0ABC8K1D4_ERUVS|nr:unnamed protein product [Eruca vesicaria subsp. sativa]